MNNTNDSKYKRHTLESTALPYRTTKPQPLSNSIFNLCTGEDVTGQHQTILQSRQRPRLIQSKFIIRQPDSTSAQHAQTQQLQWNQPRRLLELPKCSYIKPRKIKPPTIIANKFECGNYVQTAEEYQDLDEQTRKKECYQRFLKLKRGNTGSWNKTFEQLYSKVDTRDPHYLERFDRIVLKQLEQLY